MRSILEMVNDNMDKVVKVPMFCVFAMLIVIIVFFFIKREGIVKYLFGLLLLAVAMVTFIVAITNLTDPVALSMLEYFVLSLASGIVSLCTAWFLDIFFVKKRNRRQQKG